MDSFKKVVEFVLKHEGGYVFNKNDSGGETKFGISKRAYPSLDIRNLTEKEVKEIYRRDYWIKIKGDDLPFRIRAILFDTAVNCGVFKASLWFQMAIKTVCKKNIALDGIIGPKTLEAFEGCNRCDVAMYVLSMRLKHYLSIGGEFLKGWMDRVADLQRFISMEVKDGCKRT